MLSDRLLAEEGRARNPGPHAGLRPRGNGLETQEAALSTRLEVRARAPKVKR